MRQEIPFKKWQGMLNDIQFFSQPLSLPDFCAWFGNFFFIITILYWPSCSVIWRCVCVLSLRIHANSSFFRTFFYIIITFYCNFSSVFSTSVRFFSITDHANVYQCINVYWHMNAIDRGTLNHLFVYIM